MFCFCFPEKREREKRKSLLEKISSWGLLLGESRGLMPSRQHCLVLRWEAETANILSMFLFTTLREQFLSSTTYCTELSFK